MNPNLLILEDDPDRTTRFLLVAARLSLTPRIWPTAAQMLAEAPSLLPMARLVSLDHDPDPELPADSPNPGDGWDVAKWLAERVPVCPVIVHTSNSIRGEAMEAELGLANWQFQRVYPIGDDWIEVDWFQAARRLLRKR